MLRHGQRRAIVILFLMFGALEASSARSQGFALKFDGVNDLVTFGRVSPVAQHTVEAWVKPESANPGIVVGQAAGPGEACTFGFYLRADASELNYVTGRRGCGNDDDNVGETTSVLGRWTHLAGTYDGSRSRLFVNGQLVSEIANPGFDASTWMTAGAITFFNGHQFHFAGMIDEVRVWNTVRTGPGRSVAQCIGRS